MGTAVITGSLSPSLIQIAGVNPHQSRISVRVRLLPRTTLDSDHIHKFLRAVHVSKWFLSRPTRTEIS